MHLESDWLIYPGAKELEWREGVVEVQFVGYSSYYLKWLIPWNYDGVTRILLYF